MDASRTLLSSIHRLLEASRTIFPSIQRRMLRGVIDIRRSCAGIDLGSLPNSPCLSLAADLARVLHAMIPIAPLKIHHRAHHRTRNTGCQAVLADVFRLSSLIWELRQLPSLLALSASMPASFACCAASILLRPLFGIGLSGIREAITITKNDQFEPRTP